jgi:hypothetical protein
MEQQLKRYTQKKIQTPEKNQTFLTMIQKKVTRIKQSYIAQLHTHSRVTSEILGIVQEINSDLSDFTLDTTDQAIYMHLYTKIRKLRQFILELQLLGGVSDTQDCIAKQNDTTLSHEYFQNIDFLNSTYEKDVDMDDGDELDDIDLNNLDQDESDGSVEYDVPDDIDLDKKKKKKKKNKNPKNRSAEYLAEQSILDLSVRELLHQFIFVWGDIFKDIQLAIIQAQTTSLSNTFTTIVRSLIHIDRLTCVGIGIMVLSILIYVLIC